MREVVILAGGSIEEAKYSVGTATWLQSNLAASSCPSRIIVLRDAQDALNSDGIRSLCKDDLIINATHGGYGEDGTLQGFLETLGIPYTGCGVAASAICMDKYVTNRILASHDVFVPEATCMTWLSAEYQAREECVIKPVSGGSSVGVNYLAEYGVLPADAYPFGERLIREEYVGGAEVSVAMFDQDVLGAAEVVLPSRVQTQEYKYGLGKVVHVPPRGNHSDACRTAWRAGVSLGCRGHYRVDLRQFCEDGAWYVLEVNTQPAMTANSLFVRVLRNAGIEDGFALRIAADASLNR